MSYHNTLPLKGKELEQATKKARTQDEIIRNIINKYKGSFSPKQVYKDYPIMNTPITSIRRALNTLKKDGFIKETGEVVEGLFGRAERQLVKV